MPRYFVRPPVSLEQRCRIRLFVVPQGCCQWLIVPIAFLYRPSPFRYGCQARHLDCARVLIWAQVLFLCYRCLRTEGHSYLLSQWVCSTSEIIKCATYLGRTDTQPSQTNTTAATALPLCLYISGASLCFL